MPGAAGKSKRVTTDGARRPRIKMLIAATLKADKTAARPREWGWNKEDARYISARKVNARAIKGPS